jgi:hypothetical protein
MCQRHPFFWAVWWSVEVQRQSIFDEDAGSLHPGYFYGRSHPQVAVFHLSLVALSSLRRARRKGRRSACSRKQASSRRQRLAQARGVAAAAACCRCAGKGPTVAGRCCVQGLRFLEGSRQEQGDFSISFSRQGSNKAISGGQQARHSTQTHKQGERHFNTAESKISPFHVTQIGALLNSSLWRGKGLC